MRRRARAPKRESSFRKGVGMGCGLGCVYIVGSFLALAALLILSFLIGGD